MSDERRRAITTPGTRRDPSRRGPFGVLVSVAVHVVVLAVLLRVVVVPSYDFLSGFDLKRTSLPVERIGFLQLPRAAAPQREAPRAGGDNRPEHATPAPVLPTPPAAVPAAIPERPKPAEARPDTTGGAGPLVGAGGATRGLRPTFSDPRVWAPPAPVVSAPMSPKARLDSVIAANVRALQDSLGALPVERAPGDWTFTRRGKKYGIDQRYIHLGDFSIPTAILAMLPLNAAANPSVMDRGRVQTMMRGEIQEQAARSARDDEFRAAVKALRERKEKERQEQKKKSEPIVTPDRP